MIQSERNWVKVPDAIERQGGYPYIQRVGKSEHSGLLDLYRQLTDVEQEYLNSDDYKMHTENNRIATIGRVHYWMAGIASVIDESDVVTSEAHEIYEQHKDEVDIIRKSEKFSKIDSLSSHDIVNALLGNDEVILTMLQDELFPLIQEYSDLFLTNDRPATRIDNRARALCEKRVKRICDGVCQVKEKNPFALGRLFRSYDRTIRDIYEAETERIRAETSIEKDLSEMKIRDLEEHISEMKNDYVSTIADLHDLRNDAIEKIQSEEMIKKSKLQQEVQRLKAEKEKIREVYSKRYKEKSTEVYERISKIVDDIKTEKEKLERYRSKLDQAIENAKEKEQLILNAEIEKLTGTVNKLEDQKDLLQSKYSEVEKNKKDIEDRLNELEDIINEKRKGHLISSELAQSLERTLISRFERKIHELIRTNHIIRYGDDNDQIQMSNATVSHAEIVNVEGDDIPHNWQSMYIFTDKGHFMKKEKSIGICTQFHTHSAQFRKHKVDSMSVSLKELLFQMQQFEKEAIDQGIYIIACIASPTGWTDEAVNHIKGSGKFLPFTSALMTIMLMDLSPARYGHLLFNKRDPQIKMMLPCFEQTLDKEEKQMLMQTKRQLNRTIEKNRSFSLDKFMKGLGYPLEIGYRALNQLEADGKQFQLVGRKVIVEDLKSEDQKQITHIRSIGIPKAHPASSRTKTESVGHPSSIEESQKDGTRSVSDIVETGTKEEWESLLSLAIQKNLQIDLPPMEPDKCQLPGNGYRTLFESIISSPDFIRRLSISEKRGEKTYVRINPLITLDSSTERGIEALCNLIINQNMSWSLVSETDFKYLNVILDCLTASRKEGNLRIWTIQINGASIHIGAYIDKENREWVYTIDQS